MLPKPILVLVALVLLVSPLVSAHEEEQAQVKEPTADYGILGAGGALILAGIAAYLLSPKKKGKRVYSLHAGILLSLGVIVTVGYSGYFYYAAQAQQGIVVCDETGEKCFFQAHIHSLALISVCGVEKKLPREGGVLTEAHSHEEGNVVHWHDRLPYDNMAKRLLNNTPLLLGEMARNFGLGLTNECLGGYCNGGACPDGSKGTLKAFVNTENYFDKGTPWARIEKPAEYEWDDCDIVYIAFDARTIEETGQYLSTQRITWPIPCRGLASIIGG